jgi:hypothetical protein
MKFHSYTEMALQRSSRTRGDSAGDAQGVSRDLFFPTKNHRLQSHLPPSTNLDLLRPADLHLEAGSESLFSSSSRDGRSEGGSRAEGILPQGLKFLQSRWVDSSILRKCSPVEYSRRSLPRSLEPRFQLASQRWKMEMPATARSLKHPGLATSPWLCGKKSYLEVLLGSQSAAPASSTAAKRTKVHSLPHSCLGCLPVRWAVYIVGRLKVEAQSRLSQS